MRMQRIPGDVVLVHYQEQPAVYARIESVEPDVKKDWYQVTLLLLTIPPEVVTWILRSEYLNGEGFTMGGRPMRLAEVERVVKPLRREEPRLEQAPSAPSGPGKVVPFKKPPQ